MARFDIKELNKDLPDLGGTIGGTLGSGHNYVPDDWSMYPLSSTPPIDPDMDLWHARGQRSRDGGRTRLYGAKSGSWGQTWDEWAPSQLSAAIWNIEANTEPGARRDKLIAEAKAKYGGPEPSIRDWLGMESQEPLDDKGDPADNKGDPTPEGRGWDWSGYGTLPTGWQSGDFWNQDSLPKSEELAWLDPEYGYADKPEEKQYLKDTGLYNPEGSEYQFQDLLDSSPTPIPNVGVDRAKPLIEEALGIPDPDYIQDEGGRPAGTGGGKVWDTLSPFLIPESERKKMNDPFRHHLDSSLPSYDETLITSADPSNLKINTDTDTDAARAAKQREVIDENLGFGIARDWETTNNQLRDTSTNTDSFFLDPAKLPSPSSVIGDTVNKTVRGAMDQLERVGNIDTPWDWADSALDTVGGIGRTLGGASDTLSGLLASWGQQTGLKNYTYDDPYQAKISDRELQRTAEATKAWADTLTRDQRVDLYNRQQAGERNRLTSDQYGKNEYAEGSLNEAINLPAAQDQLDNSFSGQYNVLNNVQDVVWKELPTGQIVPSGLRDNYQLDSASDHSAGKIPGMDRAWNPLRWSNTLMRNIGRAVGTHDESNPNFASQGYDPEEFAGSNTYGQYQGTMRMPTMLDFGKYTPKATYSGQGQQKFGKNLMGISSNLISPSTGGGSSAMQIQSANKKGFGY